MNYVKYDIVIVGAGPAGCTVAKNLSRKFNVLLIDKDNLPRKKPCGGVLIEESVEFIKKLKFPEDIFSNPKELKLAYSDFDLEKEVIQNRKWWNINREKFDKWLLESVRSEVLSQTTLIDFVEKDDLIELIISNGGKKSTIKTKYLISAEGAMSTVRSKISDVKTKKYVAMQEWIKVDHSLDKFIYILSNEITDYYSWIIPKNDNLLIGAAFPELEKNKNEKFEKLKKNIKEKYGFSGNTIKKEGAMIFRPMSKEDIILGKNNIFLIGESAGLISPSTGEGISYALRSAKFCAESINLKEIKAMTDYIDKSKILVDDIFDKIIKANLYSDKNKRLEFFNEISK